MRLILLPALPSNSNGYGIAVKDDISKLSISNNDIVVYYTKVAPNIGDSIKHIERFPRLSSRRIINLLLLRTTTEISTNDLKKVSLDLDTIDEIFCGEVVFYRALRALFPSKKIIVRFHNCYARIYDRLRLFKKGNISFVYNVNLKLFYRLEKEIFNDDNTYKIFISDEDRNYYVNNSGRISDSEVWGFTPSRDKMICENKVEMSSVDKLVWFGGLDSHKIDSVKWFTQSVFPTLKAQYPWLEFHLYGKGSEQFDNPSLNIFGHGFYEKQDMPYKENALYINPDLTGGGVKIKLLTYFEGGLRFLTTPYGYEGYPKELIDGIHCIVVEPERWLEYLKSYFGNNGF